MPINDVIGDLIPLAIPLAEQHDMYLLFIEICIGIESEVRAFLYMHVCTYIHRYLYEMQIVLLTLNVI